MRARSALLVAVAWLLVVGCGKEEPPPAKKPEETAPALKPTLPEDALKGTQNTLSSRVLVTGETAKEQLQKKQYIADAKIPGGTIRGRCFIRYDKDVRVLPPFPIEVSGENAIKDPQKGEVDYYESRQPASPAWLAGFYSPEKRYGVKGAVIRVKGVEAGSVASLDWVSFRMDYRTQQILASVPQGEGVNNGSWYTVGLSPLEGMVQLVNLGLYPCHIVCRHAASGKTVFDQDVKGYEDKKFPGRHYGTIVGMQPPGPVQMPPFKETGVYEIACTRHPWHKAQLIVSDNPYVTVTADQEHEDPGRTGEFTIDKVPPGKYQVEVWHPAFEPVQKTYEVEVAADQTAEILAEFKAPPALTGAPRLFPNQPITEWAFVGPLPPLFDEEPDAPNNKLSFSGSYEGLGDNAEAWRKIGADKSGQVNWRAALGKEKGPVLLYFATQLASPKEQAITFAFGHCFTPTVWLNKKVVYQQYPGDIDKFGRDFLVTCHLKAGNNLLLIMFPVPADNPYVNGFSLAYVAEGVDAKAPLK